MTNARVRQFDVVVVGAGFAGLYLIKRLTDCGFSVRAVEAAPEVGGTWYWNRYPGVRCDLESFDYAYSWSAELDNEWAWSERYPMQTEILQYAKFVADRFQLRQHIDLNTRVTAAHFDESRSLWHVTTDRLERLSAPYCVMASGGLSVPKPPSEFLGLENFTGSWHHTGLWPPEGVDFQGKTVAVIGTGSSAVQCIPIIAEQANRLCVFQRTPNFTVPAINYPLSADMIAEFRRTARERHLKARHSRYGIPVEFPTQSALSVDAEERQRTFEKAWKESHLLGYRLTYADILTNELANDTVADFLRGKIKGIVEDPVVAESLTPRGFPFGTKRPCLGRGYYETFNRKNVQLVDLRKTPLVQITASGIETTTDTFAFDHIVFATGYDALTGAVARIDVRGRGGLTLNEKWKDGPRAYLGLMTHHFPNLFLITGPGSPGPLSNMMISIEQGVEWIADCLVYLRQQSLSTIEAEESAEITWAAHVQEVVSGTLYLRADSWYLGANVPGKPRVFMPYLGGAGVYREKCDQIARSGYTGFLLGPEKGVGGQHPTESFSVAANRA